MIGCEPRRKPAVRPTVRRPIRVCFVLLAIQSLVLNLNIRCDYVSPTAWTLQVNFQAGLRLFERSKEEQYKSREERHHKQDTLHSLDTYASTPRSDGQTNPS